VRPHAPLARQGNREEDLPEAVLACARVSRVDFKQARASCLRHRPGTLARASAFCCTLKGTAAASISHHLRSAARLVLAGTSRSCTPVHGRTRPGLVRAQVRPFPARLDRTASRGRLAVQGGSPTGSARHQPVAAGA
jgi:hypothetical protein